MPDGMRYAPGSAEVVLRRRVQLLFVGLVVILLAGMGVDAVADERRSRTTARSLERLAPARHALDRLLTSLVDQETGQRGFLLTGDDRFLEPYWRGVDEAPAHLVRLRELLAEDPSAVAGIERLRSRVNAWQQLGADFEIAARRAEGGQLVNVLVGSGTSKRLFDQVREEVASLSDVITREEALQADRAEDLRQLRRIVRVANVVAALLLLAVAGRLVRAWVTQPLEALGATVRRAAGGDIHEPIAVEGPPDLVALAADVDAMRRRLLEEVDDAARARAALADRGMIVVTLRDDLAPTPVTLPGGLGLTGRFRPARGMVAGDWWDAIRLDDDRVVVALVDVSGHGAEVATFALRTKALTLAAMASHSPGETLEWLASHLGQTGELFLTGVIVEVSASTGRVRYASAGHPPLLLAGLTGVQELAATGPLLGPFPGRWETAEAQLHRGGVLVAYSDGVPDARNGAGDLYGVRRLSTVVGEHQMIGVEGVADAAIRDVTSFAPTVADDVTLVVIGR